MSDMSDEDQLNQLLGLQCIRNENERLSNYLSSDTCYPTVKNLDLTLINVLSVPIMNEIRCKGQFTEIIDCKFKFIYAISNEGHQLTVKGKQ